MKKVFILLCLLITQTLLAQKFDIKSPRVNLNIKYPPKDTIAPNLTIDFPRHNIIKGLPVYQRDSVVSIIGKASDNIKLVKLLINGQKPDSLTKDKFIANVALSHGLNNVQVEAIDESNNKTVKTVQIFQDNNQDIYPPDISLDSSFYKSRGINVVPVAVSGDSISIRGKVEDSSGLYGVWVNDSLIHLSADHTFTLVYGKNPQELTIKAIDKYGNENERDFKLNNLDNLQTSKNTLNSDSIKAGKYYALLIANQKYHDLNIPDLDYPVKNIKSIYKTLIKYYTFKKSNIITLENPNRAKIIKTLDNLSRKLKSTDNLLIFYAGHGVWDSDLKQGFWLPSDATANDKSEWLSNGNIRDYIRGIKTKHTLLITDACFGGAIFKSRDILFNAPVSIKKIYEIPSRNAMTSGAMSAVPDESVFVEYLIKRLTENKAKYLPAENLYYNIREAVINNSPTNQIPEYGVIFQAGDEGGGSFIFIHK